MNILENAIRGVTAVMQRCTGSTFTAEATCSDAQEIMEANAVVMRLPDYITENEDGSYTYQYDKIHELVQKGEKMTNVDVRIAAAVTMTTAQGDEINLDALNQIIACDDPEKVKETGEGWTKVYEEMNRRSTLMAYGCSDYLTLSDDDYKNLPEEQKELLQTVKNSIALSDMIATVGWGYHGMEFYYEQIKWYQEDIEQNQNSIQEMSESYFNYYGVLNDLIAMDKESIAHDQAQIDEYMKKVGNITVSAEQNVNGSFYKIQRGETDYAAVTGYGWSDTNCGILEAEVVIHGGENIKGAANALKYDTSQTVEEYVAKNWDESEAFINMVKKIPYADDIIGTGYDYAMATGYAIKGAVDGEDYSDKILDHTIDGTSEMLGVVKESKYEETDPVTKKTIVRNEELSDAADATKKVVSFGDKVRNFYVSENDVKEAYYEQQRRYAAWNQEVDKVISAEEQMERSYKVLAALRTKYIEKLKDKQRAFGSMTMYYDDYRFSTNLGMVQSQ